MSRVATKLTTNQDGSFSARKRIPEDVQDAYAKMYDVRWEERFNSGPALTAVVARAKHREWLSKIEARIASIRAERNGEGRTLTPKQARGLAGDWYDWFTARGLRSAVRGAGSSTCFGPVTPLWFAGWTG